MEDSSIGTSGAERRQGPPDPVPHQTAQRSVEAHEVLQGPDVDPQASAQPPKKQQPESRRRTMSNSFMMLRYKISMCKRTDPHNWRLCPYAHDGEAGRRRPPHTYQAVMCDFTKSKECPHGETCPFARNALEYWLHPDKYRTTLCGQGEACNRNICFFAHNQQELRTPGSEPLTKAGRKKAESDLASQLTSGAGSSSSGQQLLQVQQQLAQLAMGIPHQMVAGSSSGRSSSSAGRGADLAQASAGGGQDYQQAWFAQAPGVAGSGAQQGASEQSTLAAAAQAAAAVASGRGSLISPEQYRRVTALQPAMQGVLTNVPGAVSPMAGAAGRQASAAPGALAAAGAMYPMYGSVPGSHQQQQQQQVFSPSTFPLPQQQQQQQQVISPAAGSSTEALPRPAAAQQVQQQALQAQPGLVPGMPPSPGWGMSAYAGAPAGTSSGAPRLPTGLSAGQEAAMQAGQMYPVGMVQYQPGPGGVGGQAVWLPQHAQHAYGGSVPVMSSPQAAAYMQAWQGAAPQQQGMAGQQPQQLMTLLQAQQQAGQAMAMLPAGTVLSVLPQGACAPAEQYMGSAEAALQGAQGVQHYRPPLSTRGL